jgi:hypothetical protein
MDDDSKRLVARKLSRLHNNNIITTLHNTSIIKTLFLTVSQSYSRWNSTVPCDDITSISGVNPLEIFGIVGYT